MHINLDTINLDPPKLTEHLRCMVYQDVNTAIGKEYKDFYIKTTIEAIAKEVIGPKAIVTRSSVGYNNEYHRYYINIHVRDEDCNTHVLYLVDQDIC